MRNAIPSFCIYYWEFPLVPLVIARHQYMAFTCKNMVKWRGADFSTTGTDISGATALMHSISTKPYFDPEFAQLMLDAGGDINRRDRFGGIAAHDIATVQLLYDHTAHEKAGRALQWFLEHGGNLDVEDGDGICVRQIIASLEMTDRTLKAVVDLVEQQKSEGSNPAITRPTARNSPCPCGSGRKFKKCCGKE